MENTAPSIERPPPGHYQGRLSTVLGTLPADAVSPGGLWEPAPTPRRLIIRPRRRRTGQLALPLELLRG